MYNLYIEEHRENVKKAFKWLKDNDILKDFNDDVIMDAEYNCSEIHDESKLNPDEYEAYDLYFYGKNRSYQVVQDFNKAWLLHIHRNPHHWQHWVLINDDPNEDEIIIDMPDCYIIEMICDWWSFSWKKDNLNEIFEWYEKRKSYIKLSDSTREKVENILNEIKEKLQ
jgi:hypothetical protein